MPNVRFLLRSALPLSLVLGLAACSSTPATSVDTAGVPAAGASIGNPSAGPAVTDYAAYLGATAGAADQSRSPVTIGWVNVEGGPGGTPEATLGAQAAVRYVNEKLGGIGGHPLKLLVCTVVSAEEEGQKCGQQLANDSSVAAIGVGNLYVGDRSFTSVVAGQKPVLVGVATGPALSTAKDTFALFGDLPHIFGAWGTYAKEVLAARTAAVIHTNTPGDNVASAAVVKALQTAGLTVKTVGFDAQSTDLLGPVTASGAATADIVVPVSVGTGCVGIAKALQSLGVRKPVVSTPICLTPDVAQGLGGDLPTWTYGIAQTLPTDPTAADSKAFLAASAEAGLRAGDASKVFAPLAWTTILTYAKVFDGLGPDKINAASVTAALQAFHGPVIMGAPEVTCGKYPAAPAVCNDQSRFYQYQGKGQFKALTGWLRPVG
ncbi:ABC transporter substrate-binding protein [Actinoplanes subtropicus]|uniref:ABC transporter substrate-binding protein n=1 Tax=Actinoplanes subtropicus TaxID=543632 RepID=UPI0004C3A201|nr:ABC transporter substrate-binding protein [Actinoplanes subtropicus]